VDRLEAEIDQLNADIAPLNSFILPGGSALAAHLYNPRQPCYLHNSCKLLQLQTREVV